MRLRASGVRGDGDGAESMGRDGIGGERERKPYLSLTFPHYTHHLISPLPHRIPSPSVTIRRWVVVRRLVAAPLRYHYLTVSISLTIPHLIWRLTRERGIKAIGRAFATTSKAVRKWLRRSTGSLRLLCYFTHRISLNRRGVNYFYFTP